MLLLLSYWAGSNSLWPPVDCSLPGSSVHGISQARILEWVAISFSNAWKWKVKVKSVSRVLLLVTPWTAAHQAPLCTGFPRQEYWSGVLFPTSADLPDQGSDLHLLHWRVDSLPLSPQGSPNRRLGYDSPWLTQTVCWIPVYYIFHKQI